LNPRGLYLFGAGNQEPLWQYLIAPYPTSAVCVDLQNEGANDILMGSAATDNGNRLPDGTDDAHSYIYAISRHENLLWRREMEGYFSETMPLVLPVPGGKTRLYAMVSSSPEVRNNETGVMVELGPHGEALARYDAGARLYNCVPVANDERHPAALVCADRLGFVHILDPDLKPRGKAQVIPNPFGVVNMEVVGVESLVSHGPKQIILQASQVEIQASRTVGETRAAVNQVFWHENSILVVDQQLTLPARYLVAEKWSANYVSWSVKMADWDGDGAQEILSLTTDVKVLKFER
jgi:hypothetical protein